MDVQGDGIVVVVVPEHDGSVAEGVVQRVL